MKWPKIITLNVLLTELFEQHMVSLGFPVSGRVTELIGHIRNAGTILHISVPGQKRVLKIRSVQDSDACVQYPPIPEK